MSAEAENARSLRSGLGRPGVTCESFWLALPYSPQHSCRKLWLQYANWKVCPFTHARSCHHASSEGLHRKGRR